MIAYLWEVLVRFKYALGGGSSLIIVGAIIEHFTANVIPWPTYLWLLAACLVITLVRHGTEQYKALAPRLKIHKLTRREWPDPNGRPGAEYYFEVFNSGQGQSIEDINVELVRMDPDPIGYLPVHLHIKHDNKPPNSTEFAFATAFSLHPNGGKQIDLVTGPTASSPHSMIIPHIVRDAMTPIPRNRYRLFVRATAKNTPPAEAIFETWVDSSGALLCIQL
jgi:hypothetical protein